MRQYAQNLPSHPSLSRDPPYCPHVEDVEIFLQNYFLESAAESNFLIKPAVDGSPVITVGGDFLLEEGSGEYMRVQIYEGGLTHKIFLKSKPVNQTALNFTAALRGRYLYLIYDLPTA